jgi:hypothetical protein
MGYIQFDATTGRQFSVHRTDERLQRKSFGRRYVESHNAAKTEKFEI